MHGTGCPACTVSPPSLISTSERQRSLMCEADERNQQALFILENEWGCGRIDVGELQRILRGNTKCSATNG